MSIKKIRIISKGLIFALILSVLFVESISVLGYTSLYIDYTVSTVFNMNELKSSEMLMAKVSVTNNSKSSDPIMAIIALYNPGGSMLSIAHTSKSVPIGTTEILSVGFELPDDITGHVVKVFVWGGLSVSHTNMNPISNVVYITETGISENNPTILTITEASFNSIDTILLTGCQPTLDGKTEKNFILKRKDTVLVPGIDYILSEATTAQVIILKGDGIPAGYTEVNDYTVAYVGVNGYLDGPAIPIDTSIFTVTDTPTLQNARFAGLTMIRAACDEDLTGSNTDDIQVMLSDNSVLPSSKILSTLYDKKEKILTVKIDSSVFARITSEGTTIATEAFGKYSASKPASVRRTGEEASNGYITSSNSWTHYGHNTDYDSFASPQPNVDIYGSTVATANDTKVPVEKDFRMLVLFVEFPNAKNTDATDSYNGVMYNSGMQAYMDYLTGAKQWYAASSYDQMKLNLISPQNENNLGWIQMSKESLDYVNNGFFNTSELHIAYIQEVCQYAFDNWGIRADDYDGLCIMPAKSQTGLLNGPAYISGAIAPAYVENGTNHYIKTAVTAGADLYDWGYRWLLHESGHTFGLSDLYGWSMPDDQAMFWIGGWGIMGDIGGQSSEHFAWEKWKFGWIRDDQIESVTQQGEGTYYLSPVETPGGSKLVVIPVSSSLAYVAEFRTKQGNNADRAEEWGVLIYRIDSSVDSSTGPVTEDNVPKACVQVISNTWYKQGFTTPPFRPISSSVTEYGQGCCFQPGDSFIDTQNGITIKVDDITNYNVRKLNGLYDSNDTAVVTIKRDAP